METGDFRSGTSGDEFCRLKFAGDKVVGNDGVSSIATAANPARTRRSCAAGPRPRRPSEYLRRAGHLAKRATAITRRIAAAARPASPMEAAHNARVAPPSRHRGEKGGHPRLFTVCRGDGRATPSAGPPRSPCPPPRSGMPAWRCAGTQKSDFMDPQKVPTPLTAWEELRAVLFFRTIFSWLNRPAEYGGFWFLFLV